MKMRISVIPIMALALVAVPQAPVVCAELIPYTLTIENNTELHLTIAVKQNTEMSPYPRWDVVAQTFNVGPVSTAKKTFPLYGRLLVVFTPSRCGNPRQFPELRKETWALPNQNSKYYVLQDSDFGKSLILPQCPERLADSPDCARAREEVARLDALRQEPELLEGHGWALSDRVTLPESGGKMYDRIMAIKGDLQRRRQANPAAPRMDPDYRNLAQEENRLNELYNARMAALIREEEVLAQRNVVDVATLTAHIQAAGEAWQAARHRYPHATEERDRACTR